MKKQVKILFLFSLLVAISLAQESTSTSVVKSYKKDLNGSIVEFEWCGTNEIFDDETDRVNVAEDIDDSFDTRVFILTDTGKVFKSNTYGKSWINLTEKFSNTNEKEDFFATEISVSPVDGTTVYIWGKSTVSYVSEMCGKTWRSIEHPSDLFDFRFHRRNKKWILAHAMKQCQELDDDCNPTHKILYVSKDGGSSFVKVSENVLEATWNRMTNFYNQEGPGIIMAIEIETGPKIVYTDDFGTTFNTIQEGGDNFYQADYFLFLTVKPKKNKNSYQLKIATLFDDFKYFLDPKDIKLPFDSKDHLSFTILKSDQAQVFVSIHHETEDFKQSNVYVSDWRGYELGLSLLYNVRDQEGNCDFEKIQSNEGVYIANTYDSSKVEEMKAQKRKTETKKEKQILAKKNLNLELAQYKKSVISYDNGANWHQLKAPSKKWNGKTYTCSGECSLHLIGRTFKAKGQIYSSNYAPGLIVSVGNVGLHLAQRLQDMNTYLSNDGGHTWNEILAGPHVFEIGDHGGIIIAASAVNKTNTIFYSWDEGKTWSKHDLNIQAFEIDSITTEPNNMEQRFIIQGRSKASGSPDNAIVVLFDLTDLHTRGCIGAEHPDRHNSDYQTWYPTNFKGEQCIFGKKYSYVRRKPDVQCFNSISLEQKVIKEECPCSEEDWECDFGFYRKDNQGDCIPMNDKFSQENLKKPPIDCVWRYSVSKGYRKTPGNYCNGGVDKAAELLDCPAKIVEARVEEESESFKNYKIEQQRQMEILKNNWIKAEETAAEQRRIASSQTFQWIQSILMILLVVAVLGSAFYFKDYITLAIRAIGELGSKARQEERTYRQIQSIKTKGSSASYSSKKQTKDVEEEDNRYDYEDQEAQLEQQEKPVLQRDRENYFNDSYD